jgi:peptide/nickel transport system ATP-binding protein/oligopeptide transport system ATP-binding protein
MPLLETKRLCVDYPLTRGWKSWFGNKHGATLRAVNNVSFSLPKGQALGVVGESGCGKSTLGRTLLRLEKPSSGEVMFEGMQLSSLEKEQLLDFRRRAQMIFQEPVGALNPRLTIRQALLEVVTAHGLCEPGKKNEYVEQIATDVDFPISLLDRKPRALSGGQCQRAGIARAMAVGAELLIADEPVSSLDVSVQATIMNLFKRLKEEFDLTVLFISHDLSTVRYLCDKIAIMYLGSIVEYGPAEQVFSEPKHPYTQALIASVPRLDEAGDELPTTIEGDPPSPADPPQGCPFHTRCPHVFDPCKKPPFPQKHQVDEVDVWCHLYDDSQETASL